MVSMSNISTVETRTTIFQAALAGGVAGAITRAVAQPLDVLKIRFQLQVEPISYGSKYSSVLQGFASIIREEGLTTLWSGHTPAQILSISYGLLQFASFEKLTQLCQSSDPQFYLNHKHSINFSSGAVAATIATIGSFPFDTVRTRLIAEPKTQKVYQGFINAILTIVRTEGIRTLFKGLTPTLGQIAPHAGVQFAVYKLFTENIFNKIEFFQRQGVFQSKFQSTMSANLLAGSISGFFAKTMIYPFDLVKKRLQIQGFQKHRGYFGKQFYCKGVLHCLKVTIVEEGFMAIYKGYVPSMIKAVLVTSLHFTVYDEIKYLFARLDR